MDWVVLTVMALHAAAGVFWAGSVFAVARLSGANAERLFGPQMGASVVVFVTGIILWYLLHGDGFGGMEKMLAFGIFCAFAAAGVLGAVIGPATRALPRADGDAAARLRLRIATGYRIAAGLLAATVISMVIARYF